MLDTLVLDRVAVLRINNPPVNVLSTEVSAALLAGIDAANVDPAVIAIVVMGAGRTFVAGADIRSLEQAALGHLDAAVDMHDTLARIEDSRKPVVMAMHGSALGGGLELAMAGRYRVAAADTQLGQPEVNLGIIPGAEGTQRLPRLVGVAAALDLCVTGTPCGARDALAIGLVDRIIDGDLLAGAAAFAREIAALPGRLKTRERADRLGTPVENETLFANARTLAATARPGELAPLRVIEAVQAAAVLPFEDGRRREREIFFECVQTDQARSMIRAFFERKRKRRVRSVRIGDATLSIDRRDNGTTYARATAPLGSYPATLLEPLERWARDAGERAFLAERGPDGAWQTTSYDAMLRRVRAVAQALLDRRLSPDRPIAILSGNSVDHATLGLAAMYAGIPYAPVSPAYSLLSRDYDGLRCIFNTFRPGLVFVEDGRPFEAALDAVLGADAELVASSPGRHSATPFAELLAATPSRAVDDARRAIGAETIGKILFTSGSTGRPKGVINTQGMLCANQAMIAARLAFLADAPPVLCDWLPWNHTFGGNHNFNITLYHGGAMYIDRGRPTPDGFGETVRCLHDVAPTVYFNVPRGYEMLVPRLRESQPLRERFFSRLQLLFFAAAGLTQKVWDDLQQVAVDTCGEQILMITGLGSTETAPAALFTGHAGAASGWIGVPLPGVELKLAPAGDKTEARIKGPSVTPGYWRDETLTRAAFDEEGFYRMGDAVRWVDPAQPDRGLIFDGRLNEDFKLSTGTWVSVGPLRAKLLLHLGGLVQDLVIVGPDREMVCALLFPAPGMDGDPTARSRVRDLLRTFADAHPATSMHVTRALVCPQPPSFEAGEMTDKGSLNQKAVMKRRSREVEELYASPQSERVISIDG